MKYVDEADLATNKIRVVPKAERDTDPGSGSGPDAEDLMVLKRKVVLSSPKNAVGGRASRSRGGKVRFCIPPFNFVHVHVDDIIIIIIVVVVIIVFIICYYYHQYSIG